MTYQENIRKVAEEMAISNFKEFTTSFIVENTWDSLDDYEKKLSIEACMESARIAISFTAAEVRQALNANHLFIDTYLIERGLIPVPGALKCDHKDCKYDRCSVTNEPICACCGAYTNTVMTEDEKQQERQEIYDKADINTYRVHDRGFLCYGVMLECDNQNECKTFGHCHYSPSNEQK